MKSIKIKIENKEHSKAIQWLLFELGCGWPNKVYVVQNECEPFLYVDARCIITYGASSEIYHEHNYREVTRKELETELKNRRAAELLDLDTKPKLEGTPEHATLTPAKSYDEKGNATHYAQDRINSIEAMERIFGTQAVLHFCEINAFKYRTRIGRKTGESIKENLTKIEWYENAVKFYLNKLRSGTPIATDTKTYGLPWEPEDNEPTWEPEDNEPKAINSQGLEFETISGFRKYFNTEVAPHRFQSFVNTNDDQTIIDMWAAITEKYNLIKK